ncbi:MAG: cbb3-type cytochrome oxidase assembly protein CcoS [Bacteroidia bacterium]
MEVIFILIGISMVVAVSFLVCFLLSLKKGQYDDMYTPSVRILFENNTKTDNTKEDVKIRTTGTGRSN